MTHGYPSQYEKTVQLPNGSRVHLRPIKENDGALIDELFDHQSRETRYYRFFENLNQIPRPMLENLVRIDYEDKMAIVATIQDKEGEHIVGVVRYYRDAGRETAEYAIALADAWQGRRLGRLLTDHIIWIARKRGIRTFFADVLGSNQRMFALFRSLGLPMETRFEEDLGHVMLQLWPKETTTKHAFPQK